MCGARIKIMWNEQRVDLPIYYIYSVPQAGFEPPVADYQNYSQTL